MQKIKAVILVGGPGTRLQPLTDNIPKSVLPVLNRPFMEHTIAYLKKYGIEDIILTLSYLPEVIQDYFGDGGRFGVRLTYCIEEEPRGTAGAVKNAETYLDGTFLVLNGDIYTDLDLSDMLVCHQDNRSIATIGLKWVDDPSAFGVVETDDDQRVKAFIEKPPADEAKTNWINAGIYFLEPEVLQYIPPNSHYMFEKGLFPALLDMGEAVYSYPCRGYWLDMGTPSMYLSLNSDLLFSRTNNPLIDISNRDGIYYDRDVIISPLAKIEAPVMAGNGCRIGQGAYIKGPVVIGEDSIVEEGACVENVIIWNNVHIGAGAKLRHCIVSSNTDIKPGKQINSRILTPSRIVSFTR